MVANSLILGCSYPRWQQVDDLSKASKSVGTLKSLLDHDIEQDTVRKAGSHSRNLLRVKRGLDMVRVLFEQILASEYVCNSSSFCLIRVLEKHSDCVTETGLGIVVVCVIVHPFPLEKL